VRHLRAATAAFAVVSLAFSGYSASEAGAAAHSQRPAFSGTWIIQPPNKAAGMEQVVKQDDKTLTVSIAGRTMSHELDGVERRRTMSLRGGEVIILSTAAWDGSTIVVTTATAYPNRIKTVEKEIWSVDAQGHLVIDYTETVEGQPPRVIKVVHNKKS
jgi:hypothetical protein